MQIVKNNKTGLFNLEGMTEGKLLALQRVLSSNVLDSNSGVVQDLKICVDKGVNANIAFGTKE